MNKMREIFQELFRPQVHFTPPQNFMNDPNGLIYYKGKYHLFYQYNPYGKEWGHMSWGHAISSDLMHWKHLPIAIREEDDIMIFSGSAVYDRENSTGLAKGTTGPLIAIFTGYDNKQQYQTQNLAFSNNKGLIWTKFKDNPVLDLRLRHFRDPKVFWFEKERKWIVVVSVADRKIIRFYCSVDLKNWHYLSDFGSAGMMDTQFWECPDLFELPVENEKHSTKWVLKVDVIDNAVAGGSGSQYFVGHFDGKQFLNDNSPDKILWVDYGKDFYAAQTFNNIPKYQKRVVWIAWMNNWQYANHLPTSPWRGQMTLPRKLSLIKTENGIRLFQQPVNEIIKLRQDNLHYRDLRISPGFDPLNKLHLDQASFEIIAEFKMESSTNFGIKIFWSNRNWVKLGYNNKNRRVFLDRTNSGLTDFHDNFSGTHYAPLNMVQKKNINLHVILDRCNIEVFANNGEVVITDLIFPEGQEVKIQLFSVGGEVIAKSLELFTLKSVWSPLSLTLSKCR
jgi:fructan beta-fructosidase